MDTILLILAAPLILWLLAAIVIAYFITLHRRRQRAFAGAYNDTSALGAAIAVEGLMIQFGNGASPEVFTVIANVADITLPLTAEKVDVTNVGNTWKNRITTLLDMGAMKFKVFWIMTEPTHEDAITGSIRGIRYCFINRLLVNVIVTYPDGLNSQDRFSAFVDSFSITGKVGGVFEAEIGLAQGYTGASPAQSYV